MGGDMAKDCQEAMMAQATRKGRGLMRGARSCGLLLGIMSGGVLGSVWSTGGVLGGSAAHAQETVGMVVMVRGAPLISSGNSWKRLQLQGRVATGQQIRCPKNAEAVVVLFQSGTRFRIAPGKAATVKGATLAGAQSLGKLGGASESAAQALYATRSGAVSARGDRGGAMPRRLAGGTLGYLAEGERTLTWAKNEEASTTNFTLFDANSDVVFNLRTQSNSVTLPETLELKPRRPYVWRAVFYREGEANTTPQEFWGLVTWLQPDDIADLQKITGGQSVEQIKAGDVTTALIIARAYENKRLYQPAFEILHALSQERKLPGSTDAFLSLYGQMPAIARVLAPYAIDYSVWQFRNR
jgi:hypothetical protein